MNKTYDIKSYIKQELIDVALALFKKFDKGGKGWVEAKDLGNMLRLLEFNPTDTELKDMVDKLEEDPSNPKGQITKDGFLTCIARKARDSDTIDELMQCFKLFDTEGRGMIEEKTLRYVLCKMGSGLTEDEMDNLMKEASTMFVQVINDVKYVKYSDFALYLKDMYVPPEDNDPKNKKKNAGKKK